MADEVKIYDYFEGDNLIERWMDAIGSRPKAKLTSILNNLRQVKLQHWHTYPTVEKLKGENDLWEIKAFSADVRWRPLGMFGPGEQSFTLLVGAIEKDRILLPLTVITTAHQRKGNVRRNPDAYRRLHE